MREFIPLFPHLIALFNLLTVLFLILGVAAIRRDDRKGHKGHMLRAMAISLLFLIVYTLYHLEVGNVAFAGEGGVRTLYFSLLIAHIGGAAVVFFMVPVVIYRGWKGLLETHKPLARKTFPLWIFVSASGFVVYVMAFHLWPSVENLAGNGIL